MPLEGGSGKKKPRGTATKSVHAASDVLDRGASSPACFFASPAPVQKSKPDAKRFAFSRGFLYIARRSREEP